MTEDKMFIVILILILFIHYVCIILLPKLRKNFYRYIAVNITKKYEIINQLFHVILEKSWYIKQLVIIVISYLAIVLIKYSNNTIIYMVLFWIFAEHLYILSIIHYSKKKGLIKKR